MAVIVYNYTLSRPERKLAAKKDKQKELVFLRTSPFY